jgi:acetyltransferase-like isoleucine patch superfamily enzyme
MGRVGRMTRLWIRFWMRWAGLGPAGRIAAWLATWFTTPVYGRCFLAGLNPQGFISPYATLSHAALRLGSNVFIGDRVILFQDHCGGEVELGARVLLMDDISIHTGQGGSVRIGADTHIQRGCQLAAYKAPIEIGSDVEIGPRCAFYPYDHGFAPGVPISRQPLQTKGGIVIGDEAWLGYGVIVLSGVRIGKGAVIGAGAVVTEDVPDGAIAAGVPARILKLRGATNP